MALNDLLGIGRIAGTLSLAAAAYCLCGSAYAADAPKIPDGRNGADNRAQSASVGGDANTNIAIPPTRKPVSEKLFPLLMADTLALFKKHATSNRRINFDKMFEEPKKPAEETNLDDLPPSSFNHHYDMNSPYDRDERPPALHSEAEWHQALAKNDIVAAYRLCALMKDEKSEDAAPYRLLAALELNFSERWMGTGSDVRYLDSQTAKMRALEDLLKFARFYDSGQYTPSAIVIDQHPSKGVASSVSKEPLSYSQLKREMLSSLARISYGLEDFQRARIYREAALQIDPSDPDGIDRYFKIYDDERKLIRQTEDEMQRRKNE